MESSLREAGVPFEVWDARRLAERMPALRVEAGEVAVSQPDTGILRASRCVRVQVKRAVDQGADVREQVAVAGFESSPAGVRLTLADGETLTVDRLVVTAGPWTPALLAELGLPLRVTRQTYVHFQPEGDGAAFRLGAFPVWIDVATYFYGFPIHDSLPGAKIAWHRQGEETDPERARRELDDADRAALREYARRRFRGLTDAICCEKVCLYTNTPDEDFIVDRHPADPRIVFVGGLSGHGFKFTVLLGQIAATLATEGETVHELGRFGVGRFAH
jgi:glycine/D-amino acid oxidase-like deaminating enzyme